METPSLVYGDEALPGFFAHLDFALDTGAAELRLLLDGEGALDPLGLPLRPRSLAESISRTLASSGTEAARAAPAAAGVRLRTVVEPLVSLLLYLCSQAAEIGDGTRRLGNPQPKKTKRGPRLFQAEKPTAWDVGARLGAALRRAYQAEQTGGASQGAGLGPRPHIRRAHWHGLWSGPLDGQRRFGLRWLPPIAVNVESPHELPAVIRPVK